MRSTLTTHSEEQERITTPVYRVNFWEQPAPELAWNLDAHLVLDAPDADAVLKWAADNAAGRRYEVLVEASNDRLGESLDSPRRSTLVQLFGSSPN